jgi:Protein of unknown function (DUF1320)
MWITLTTDHIQNSLSKAECDTLTGSNSAASLQNVIQSVVSLVRGKIQSYQPNQGNLGPLGTIPEEALASAIAISRYKFLTTLPGTQLITKWREQENVDAYKLLDDISAGRLLIADKDGEFEQRQATVAPTAPPGSGVGEIWFPPYINPQPDPSWEYGYW